MSPIDELNIRLQFCESMAKSLPDKGVGFTDEQLAMRYRVASSNSIATAIYCFCFEYESRAKKHLVNAIERGMLSYNLSKQDRLQSLETVLLGKLFLLEDVTTTCNQIIDAIDTSNKDLANPMYWVFASLKLGLDHKPYMLDFDKREKRKYDLILPGATKVIDALVAKDKDSLGLSLDKCLLEHHKEANNRHSQIYNLPMSFISVFPYLMLNLSKDFGMGIGANIKENMQTLKMGLLSPADFPELAKNTKMPIKVDYLTAKVEEI